MLNMYLVINFSNRAHTVSVFVSDMVVKLISTQSFMHLALGVAQQGFRKSDILLKMIPEPRQEMKWD